MHVTVGTTVGWRRLRWTLVVTLLLAVLAPLTADAVPIGGMGSEAGGLRVGVGTADATWRVGAGAGQYTEKEPGSIGLLTGGFVDPFHHATTQRPSYGVHSRLDYRALVVEGADGGRVALVKSDSYLAQDLLTRRAAQILDDGDSGIGYEQLVLMASHNHSSPYHTTPAAGVWAFQDVMDLRAFEYHARQIAAAVEAAAGDLRPARMGATTVEHRIYKGNIAGATAADDGTPAGYPDDHADFGLSVIRFDDISGKRPEPLAVFVNHGQHPESLDDHDLITADFLAPLQRMVDRDLGATLVFSQGDVGSAEGPYLRAGHETLPDGVVRAWAHVGHAQTERGARYLADSVIEAWNEIGRGRGTVPFTTDVPVRVATELIPGPVSHPYPSVSNCRSETTVEGDPGAPVLGLPDCERSPEDLLFDELPSEIPTDAVPGSVPSPLMWEQLKALGLPVPEHYDVPAVGAVEENARIKLQAVRLGEVLLASCACEPQMDLILNLESRLDDVGGNIFDGYDWGHACTVDAALCERMQAQVHNDAAGWDDLASAGLDPARLQIPNTEPADPAQIKGNFTKAELGPEHGYALPIGLGHTSDYNGYTVSYREYMAYDHYRKALTSYGPHTADHMNTALVAMARALKDGDGLVSSPLAPVADADEARQTAVAEAIGAASSAALDAWLAALPDDAGPAEVVVQPTDVTRFTAATMTWRGGSTAVDNPTVRVERRQGQRWLPYADQSGEVPTMVAMPEGAAGFVDAWSGQHEWRWTAAFEAFNAFPTRVVDKGQVPNGTYRFVVEGISRSAGSDVPYRLESEPFDVTPWTGVTAGDARLEDGGGVSFTATADYPRTYTSPFRYVADDGGKVLCKTCSFRPWADRADVVGATVTVTGPDGQRRVPATLQDDRWVAPTGLQAGETATIASGDLVDAFGEINGDPITLLTR